LFYLDEYIYIYIKGYSKILTNRVNIICNRVISHNQNGFIKGHQIEDCVYITSEIINMLSKEAKDGSIVIKIDISKAFDILIDFFVIGASSLWFSPDFYQLDPYYITIFFSFY